MLHRLLKTSLRYTSKGNMYTMLKHMKLKVPSYHSYVYGNSFEDAKDAKDIYNSNLALKTEYASMKYSIPSYYLYAYDNPLKSIKDPNNNEPEAKTYSMYSTSCRCESDMCAANGCCPECISKRFL
uniref:Uncharacterized protein n=1 Tax=Mimivirus LCMiAC01 TaxID=2506608 RepID=A0A481Z0J1_9VIRU|nr:MAG: hypothetical protein LCMiAC01_02720 [Mimivirus LCMiAC01]